MTVDFHTAMLAAGWLPVYTLDGKLNYWQHGKVKLVKWRKWQHEYAVSGQLPPPF